MSRKIFPASGYILRALSKSNLTVELVSSAKLEKGKAILVVNREDANVMKEATERSSESIFSVLGKAGILTGTLENLAYASGFAHAVYSHGFKKTLSSVKGKLDPVQTSEITGLLDDLRSKVDLLLKQAGVEVAKPARGKAAGGGASAEGTNGEGEGNGDKGRDNGGNGYSSGGGFGDMDHWP